MSAGNAGAGRDPAGSAGSAGAGRAGSDGGTADGSVDPPGGGGGGDHAAVQRWLRCEHAWVDGAVRDDVLVGLTDDRIVAVHVGTADTSVAPTPVEQVAGLVLPGLVDAHSHCFHRALRGRTHGDGGSFWTWRTRMYELAAGLDPDRLRALARAVLAEQAEAGVTTLGEFHYLHHQPDGTPYDDPNALGLAVLDAAAEVGVRVTLLDTLYLTGELGRGLDDPGLTPSQRRFSDGSVEGWADRVHALAAAVAGRPLVHVGAALHSVRAVPPTALADATSAVPTALAPVVRDARPAVVHAHVAEQPREVEQALAVHGRTPVGLLADAGTLDDRFTAVHAVWLEDDDVSSLGSAGATVCACPTTERDLADGVVAADVLLDSGVDLALGSDQHVVTDLFEEARALELDRRLVTQRRGGIPPSALLDAATIGGARSLGWDDTGAIAPGALADLCVVDLGSSRLAGVDPERLVDGVLYAASATDVTATMVGGRWVVRDGHHVDLDTPRALREAVGGAWTAARAGGRR